MTKKLYVGRGMNRRVTKAGEKAEERFNVLVRDHLRSIGAIRSETPYEEWIVNTIHGRLRVDPHGNWIAQSFMDWPADFYACIQHARARGFDHWKWNFHYDLTEEPDVTDWIVRLGEILPPRA